MIYGLGLHAEIYDELPDLARHPPDRGMVLIHDEVDRRSIPDLLLILHRQTQSWAVVAYSLSPQVESVVAAMHAGVLDYLSYPFDPLTLANVLRRAHERNTARQAVADRAIRARFLLSALTPRESDVVEAMATGLTNKMIGRSLGISPRTVEIHRMKALAKLGARSSLDAVRMAIDAANGPNLTAMDYLDVPDAAMVVGQRRSAHAAR